MSYMRRKNSPLALRFADRRRREDDAPRLTELVPELARLRLEIEEWSGPTATQPRHIRRIVVDRAPALFLVPCGDSRCLGAEHDLTATVLQALRAHETTFHGSHECTGFAGQAACTRVLRFDAIAEYRP